MARHPGESAVARRDGLRDHRRRRGHRRRERVPAAVRRRATRHERAARDDHRRNGGSRPADVLLNAHHHRGQHPDLHVTAPRGAHLRADGVDDHVGARRLAAAVAYARSPALLPALAFPASARGESRRTAVQTDLRTDSPVGDARAGARGSDGRRRACREHRRRASARLGVSARAQRRNDLDQLQFAAGDLRSGDDGAGRESARRALEDPRSDDRRFQSRPPGRRHGPQADQHGRDVRRPLAPESSGSGTSRKTRSSPRWTARSRRFRASR